MALQYKIRLFHRLKSYSGEFSSTLNSVTPVWNGFMSNDAERNCDIEKYITFTCPQRWSVKLKSTLVKDWRIIRVLIKHNCAILNIRSTTNNFTALRILHKNLEKLPVMNHKLSWRKERKETQIREQEVKIYIQYTQKRFIHNTVK